MRRAPWVKSRGSCVKVGRKTPSNKHLVIRHKVHINFSQQALYVLRISRNFSYFELISALFAPRKTHDFRRSVDRLFSHRVRGENRAHDLRGERRVPLTTAPSKPEYY